MTATQLQRGIDAIHQLFVKAKSEKRAAFLPYFPIGFPSYEASLDAIAAMAEVGVDGFEIGVPFSDPLADGPVIQAATQKALENGVTVKKCLAAVQSLRERGVHQPMMMMSYLNPLVAYGPQRFVNDAKAVGADGLIIPDLPPEEAHYFADMCRQKDIGLTFFLAPTSNETRVALVTQNTSGFIYVVSLTGITGARADLPTDLTQFIERLKSQTDKPLVLGFGISKPEHARLMNGLVDGFIVGSALVRAGEEGIDAVQHLARSLREAL